MIWMVYGVSSDNLKVLYIKADSFDNALAKARTFDKRYCTAQIVSII